MTNPMTPVLPTVELVELEITEGSFVDKGDNPEAHIVFFKRATDEAAASKSMHEYDADGRPIPRTTLQVVNQRRAMKSMHELKEAFELSMHEILEYAVPDQLPAMLNQTATEFADLLKQFGLDAVGKQITADVASAVLEPSVELMQDGITKALAALSVETDGAPEENSMTTTQKNKAVKGLDEILSALPDSEQAVVKAKLDENAAETEAAKAAAAEKAQAEVDVSKRLADLEKRAESAEATVAAMVDEKQTAHFTSMAKQIGGADVTSMSSLLKSAYGRSEDEGKQLEEMFRGLAAQAKIGQQALFKTVGSSGPGLDDSSPEALIEADTRKLMEADPKLKYSDAYKLSLQKNRDAYARSISATRSVAE